MKIGEDRHAATSQPSAVIDAGQGHIDIVKDAPGRRLELRTP
jgi:hypothetical protein